MSNDEKKIQKSIQFSATTSLSLKNFLSDCNLEVELTEEMISQLNLAALLIIYLYSFLGKTKNYAMKKISTTENC